MDLGVLKLSNSILRLPDKAGGSGEGAALPPLLLDASDLSFSGEQSGVLLHYCA